jgi:uncharacterized protein YbcV (DUF1398 family)
MREEIRNMIDEKLREGFDGKGSFPESVKKLMDADVERYHADLARLEVTYYAKDGSSYQTKMPTDHTYPIGDVFCEESLVDALRTVQRGEITYPEFLKRAARAGTVSYTVYITGRQVPYFGKKGEMYVEYFPASL